MNTCIRCNSAFEGKYPKSKICTGCSKRGAKRGAEHWNFQGGAYTYETIRNELKSDRKCCEHCGKGLLGSTHYQWVIHHKDHDHFNNELSNLQLLCKRCHQIEHKCWLAFEGATTIPEGSTLK